MKLQMSSVGTGSGLRTTLRTCYGTSSRVTLTVAMACAMAAVNGAIAIRCNYPGGNVKVLGIDEAKGEIRISPDYRDTGGKWFHFDFTLSGAAGRTVHFRFPDDNYDYLATLGPAISADGGKTWTWLRADGSRHEPSNAFDYTFAAGESETRFAVSIPYLQSDWDEFTEQWKRRSDVKFDTLCKSRSGKRDVEVVRLPCRSKARWLFAFAARHHACETTGSLVLDGAFAEALSGSPEGEWLRENADCVFVPFMDKDGVEDGDQGKRRIPHDHNQDYLEGLYPTVRAFKNLLVAESNGRQIIYFDLHAPCVRSSAKNYARYGVDANDIPYIFDHHIPEICERVRRFRKNWIETSRGGDLAYEARWDSMRGAKNRAIYDAEKKKGLMNSRNWVAQLPNCWMSVCGEFGYSLCGGTVSRESGRRLGRSLMKAAVRTANETTTKEKDKSHGNSTDD